MHVKKKDIAISMHVAFFVSRSGVGILLKEDVPTSKAPTNLDDRPLV
jgi:hypothetical protein